MPTRSKRVRLLEEVVEYQAQRKRARLNYMLLLLPSSDPSDESDLLPHSESSDSSLSLSSLSSLSDLSSSPLRHAGSRHSSTSSGTSSDSDPDSEDLEDRFWGCSDARFQALATHLLTARILDLSPPVKKLGQLDLFLNNYRHKHPDLFRKKLRVAPHIFDRLVELIENNSVFHNNSNIPQLPTFQQLAMFLVRVGHYGNSSSPEYVAQWAGVSVGTVINTTYRCLVAFLALHDDAVMMPPEEENEGAKDFVESATCPEWRNGFLLADGTKFSLFQKPGLHGEAWFDKNKNYSVDCQVRDRIHFSSYIYLCSPPDHLHAAQFAHRRLLSWSHRQRA
jgi:hypothetical protein